MKDGILVIGSIPLSGSICESVRKRPGMYIGGSGKNGFYRLLFGLTEDLLRDAAEKTISLKLRPQNTIEISCESCSVKDNPHHFHHMTAASALGEFFEYQDEGGHIRTEKGVWVLSDHEGTTVRGVKIVWRMDRSIFGDLSPDYFIILNRMIELAALCPYTIYLSNGENRNKVVVPSGIEYFLNRSCSLFSARENLVIEINEIPFTARIAVSFAPIRADIQKSYVNSQLTEEGGTHVEGVLRGARKALKRILDFYENSLTSGEITAHLNYVVSIQMENPSWCGNTKRKLKNPDVRSIIQKQMEERLYQFLKQDIQPLKSIYPGLFG